MYRWRLAFARDDDRRAAMLQEVGGDGVEPWVGRRRRPSRIEPAADAAGERVDEAGDVARAADAPVVGDRAGHTRRPFCDIEPVHA